MSALGLTTLEDMVTMTWTDLSLVRLPSQRLQITILKKKQAVPYCQSLAGSCNHLHIIHSNFIHFINIKSLATV
jgi:hypothetical protein